MLSLSLLIHRSVEWILLRNILRHSESGTNSSRGWTLCRHTLFLWANLFSTNTSGLVEMWIMEKQMLAGRFNIPLRREQHRRSGRLPRASVTAGAWREATELQHHHQRPHWVRLWILSVQTGRQELLWTMGQIFIFPKSNSAGER